MHVELNWKSLAAQVLAIHPKLYVISCAVTSLWVGVFVDPTRLDSNLCSEKRNNPSVAGARATMAL